jgi:hypothetical protein
MTENRELPPRSEGDVPELENPGWKPLLWLAGAIVLIVALGEVLVVFGWELLELIGEGIFYIVEGSEEFLEDAVESWFHLHHWEAERYTAWAMLPVKLLLAFLVLRMLWRWKKRTVFPAVKLWAQRQWLLIRLSWRGVWWPWKALLIVVAVGFLMILI